MMNLLLEFIGCVLYVSYLAIYLGTKTVYRLVRSQETPLESSVEMPVLRPIAIPSKQRRHLSRLMVWCETVR